MKIIDFIKNKINKDKKLFYYRFTNMHLPKMHLPKTPDEIFKFELNFYKQLQERKRQIMELKYLLLRQGMITERDDNPQAKWHSGVHCLKSIHEIENELLMHEVMIEDELEKTYNIFESGRAEKDKEEQLNSFSWSVTFYERTIDIYKQALQNILKKTLYGQHKQFMKNIFDNLSQMEQKNNFKDISKLEKIVKNYMSFMEKQNKQLEKDFNKDEKISIFKSLKNKEK